jgi:hypothetical protein
MAVTLGNSDFVSGAACDAFSQNFYVQGLIFKQFLGGQRPLVPLLFLGPPFFPIILFGSTTLLTRMTGISLHMQWPLTSQLHGSFSQNEQLVFCYGSNSTPKYIFKVCFPMHLDFFGGHF